MRKAVQYMCVAMVASLMFSCSSKPNLMLPTRQVDYRNKSEITIKGRLVINDVLGAERMMVFDTLLMVTCNNPASQLMVYSTNTLQPIGGFCTRGRAGNEFLRLYSTTEQRYYDENHHVIVPLVDYMDVIKEVDVTESLNEQRTVIKKTTDIMPFVDVITVFLDNDTDNRFLYENAVTTTRVEENNRIHELDKTRIPVRISTQKAGDEMQEIPLFRRKVDVSDERDAIMPYAALIKKHPQRNLIVYECLNMDYLLFIDLDDNEKSFAIHQKGSTTFDDTYIDSGEYFIGCATATDYLFVLYYHGDYTLKNKDSGQMLPELLAFDWTGNLIKSFKMDREIFGLAYDELHKILFCLNTTEDLYAYDLNGMIP